MFGADMNVLRREGPPESRVGRRVVDERLAAPPLPASCLRRASVGVVGGRGGLT